MKVRRSVVPSSRVAVTVFGLACGAARRDALHAGREIGAGDQHTCETRRPPALRTSSMSTCPAWKFVRCPPEKIAWTRRAGPDVWADALVAPRATTASTAAVIGALRRKGAAPESKGRPGVNGRRGARVAPSQVDPPVEAQRVAQAAVVRGDDERARPVRERRLEHLERGDVEVVRRLVEEQARRPAVTEDGELGAGRRPRARRRSRCPARRR